jgi:very-short-patch-repair endonuclease
MTGPERRLWGRLCSKKLGVWFYPQQLNYGYVLDFWCPSAGLAVEVDGPCHAGRKKYDRVRDARLARAGVRTLRFSASRVDSSLDGVVASIRAVVIKRRRRR